MVTIEKCGIYGIFCANGKVLVGSSKNLAARSVSHFYHAEHNIHHNPYFQNAFNKYGKDRFEFRVLEECPENMLLVREDAWIIYLKSNNGEFGYNTKMAERPLSSIETKRKISEAQRGAKGNNYGKHPSAGTLLKMSKAHTGRIHSEETKRKMSESAKGKKKSFAARAKMSLARRGRSFGPRSEETRRKIAEAIKGKVRSEETCRRISKSKKGQVSWMKGKRHSLEAKLKMSEFHKRRSLLKGDLICPK